MSGDWTSIMRNWAAAVPPSLGLLAIGAIGGVIDHNGKARIVFLRWKDPLPASRAFSQLLLTDTRIDVARLRSKFGPFPEQPNGQNALWYKLYKTIADRAEVLHVHRDYLMNRDLAVLSLLSLIIAAPLALVAAPSPRAAMLLTLIFAAEYLLFRQAAAVYGRRLVTTVLAVKAAQR